MQRKIHMRDQVGTNKIEEIMTHYDRCSMEEWMVKFVLIGVFIGDGVLK